ncbi:MAG: hypothetical protein RML12_08165 [Xanthomonadales bacterium]|nr:hypothetical protein [Xanthomonadales bacterium]
MPAIRLLAAGGRPGPALDREEILVRERVCPDADPRPALARVGGFEILRVPPALRRSAERAGRALPLPADGALARPLAAHPAIKRGRAPDAAVAAIVGRVDAERWHATMAFLAGISRHSYGSGIDAAHDAILLRFAKAGLADREPCLHPEHELRQPPGAQPGRASSPAGCGRRSGS